MIYLFSMNLNFFLLYCGRNNAELSNDRQRVMQLIDIEISSTKSI